MPVNKRLEDVITTELSTSQCATWLLALSTRAVEAIFSDEATKPAAEGYNWIKIRDGLTTALARYREHRTHNDPDRTSSFTNLWQTVSKCVGLAVITLNTDRKAAGFEQFGITTEAALEAAVEAKIAKKLWWFCCRYCGHNKYGTAKIDDSYVCEICTHCYCIKCQTCGELHLNENIILSADGRKQFCQKCIPGGHFLCTRCRRSHAGKPHPGNGVTVEDLAAIGVAACAKCAHMYSRLSCGHISLQVHRLYPANNLEDDQRSRDEAMNAREAVIGGEAVCESCYRAFEADIRPERWNAATKLVDSKAWDIVGSKRSFGVEIEVNQARKQPAMPDDMKQYWNAKDDASLPRYGIEMSSTILKGNQGLEVLKDFCKYARDNRWAVDARCGMHTHFGVLDDTDAQREAIAMGYLMTYPVWCQFVPGSRWRNNKYCRRPPMTAEQALAKVGMIIPNLIVSNDEHARRVWVNWYALRKFGTVEIRLHHGTIVYEKIVNWVRAHLLFIDWCAGMGGPREVYSALKPFANNHPRRMFLALTAKAWWKDRKLARWLRGRAAVLHGKNSLLTPKRKCGGEAKQKPEEGEIVVKGLAVKAMSPGRGVFYVVAKYVSMMLDLDGNWVNPMRTKPAKFGSKEAALEFAAGLADAELAPEPVRAVEGRFVEVLRNVWGDQVAGAAPLGEPQFFVTNTAAGFTAQ